METMEKATVDSSALTPAQPLSLHKVHFGAVDMQAEILVWIHV